MNYKRTILARIQSRIRSILITALFVCLAGMTYQAHRGASGLMRVAYAQSSCPGGSQPVPALNGQSTAGALVVNACQVLNTGRIFFQGVSVSPSGTLGVAGFVNDFVFGGTQLLAPNQVMNAFVEVPTLSGGATYQLPTATAIVNAASGCIPGLSYDFTIRNENSGQTITVTTNTGIALGGGGAAGTNTVLTNTQRTWKLVITSCSTPAVNVFNGPVFTF